jgi:hypothetical protein
MLPKDELALIREIVMTLLKATAFVTLGLMVSCLSAGAAELAVQSGAAAYRGSSTGGGTYWTGHRGIKFFANYDTSLLDCGYTPVKVRHNGWVEVRWLRTCRGG